MWIVPIASHSFTNALNFFPSFSRLFHFPLHASHVTSIALRLHTKLICFHIQLQTQHTDLYIWKVNETILKHVVAKGSMILQTCLKGRLQRDTPFEEGQSFGLLQYSKICTSFVDNQEKSSLKWQSCIKNTRNRGPSTLHITTGEEES